jgi:hypothetical protein
MRLSWFIIRLVCETDRDRCSVLVTSSFRGLV